MGIHVPLDTESQCQVPQMNIQTPLEQQPKYHTYRFPYGTIFNHSNTGIKIH